MESLPKSIYISHGGGPLPLLGDPGHTEMVACLRAIAERIEKPSAIVVVSAHWEEPVTAITSAANPPLLYDYYNFPAEAYSIQYPCPGEPKLAEKIRQMLTDAGIESRFEADRGLDHGVFVPLKIMYPDADIPCVEISLLDSLDPAQHIAVGRALQGLSNEGVLIIGSGLSFHNFFRPAKTAEESARLNNSFEAWLREVCTAASLSESDRSAELANWFAAPGARYCHPREEHLIPLHVCYGVAETACTESFQLRIMDKSASMFTW